MTTQLSIFPYERARRVLNTTVHGELGLKEGELWYVDERGIIFWAAERLRPGAAYEMRVDMGTVGRNVDLQVTVEAVMDGRDASMGHGYVHRGGFLAGTASDESRLFERFWQENPEYEPSGRTRRHVYA